MADAKHKMFAEGDRSYVGKELGRVYETIKSGTFGGNTQAFINLIDSLVNGGDNYLVCHDFDSYMVAQDCVDTAYRNPTTWCRMAIQGIARSGKFSSDRTISEYAEQIWHLKPASIPAPSKDPKARVRSYANMPINEAD